MSDLDPLSSVLAQVPVRGSVFGTAELGAPWGVRTDGQPALGCYALVRGSAHLALLDGRCEEVTLSSGDVVLVAAGRAHALRDQPRSKAEPFERLQRAASKSAPGPFRWGGAGARTTLVCGSLTLDEAGQRLFGAALPPLFHLPAERAGPGLRGVVAALAGEVAAPQPGSAAALTRLAELLFLHALRAGVAQGVAGKGWLRGLGDPAIARALAAIHEAPGEPWTVESLAARAGMSRSAFAASFHRRVGDPPLAYLTDWRMRVAARLLGEGGAALKEIAAQVGYGSDEAFSRAFRAWSGQPPGAFRRKRVASER